MTMSLIFMQIFLLLLIEPYGFNQASIVESDLPNKFKKSNMNSEEHAGIFVTRNDENATRNMENIGLVKPALFTSITNTFNSTKQSKTKFSNNTSNDINKNYKDFNIKRNNLKLCEFSDCKLNRTSRKDGDKTNNSKSSAKNVSLFDLGRTNNSKTSSSTNWADGISSGDSTSSKHGLKLDKETYLINIREKNITKSASKCLCNLQVNQTDFEYDIEKENEKIESNNYFSKPNILAHKENLKDKTGLRIAVSLLNDSQITSRTTSSLNSFSNISSNISEAISQLIDDKSRQNIELNHKDNKSNMSRWYRQSVDDEHYKSIDVQEDNSSSRSLIVFESSSMQDASEENANKLNHSDKIASRSSNISNDIKINKNGITFGDQKNHLHQNRLSEKNQLTIDNETRYLSDHDSLSAANINSNQLKKPEHIKFSLKRSVNGDDAVHDFDDDDDDDRTVLHIGGLFELKGNAGFVRAEEGGQPGGALENGWSDLSAALLAVRHINKQQYIPGHRLRLIYNDTRCDPGYGADAFYDLVYRKPTVMMLVGISCSEVSKTIAEIAPYWNLLFISHASNSPALSERGRYPTFYRLVPADSSHNSARTALIRHLGWSIVATIHIDIELFSLTMNELNKALERQNVSIKTSLAFRSGQQGDEDLTAKMKELKESDARIIVGSFDENTARKVFCMAYRLGLYGRRYAWILLSRFSSQWWIKTGNDVTCTSEQLAVATDRYFTAENLQAILGDSKSVSGLTTEDFLMEYLRLDLPSPRSQFSQLTYDSVWTVATVLKNAQQVLQHQPGAPTLADFRYLSGKKHRSVFTTIMDNISFTGVSGSITFDGSDRRCITSLEQNQNGMMVRVGLFYPETEILDMDCDLCSPIKWINNRAPADRTTVSIENLDTEATFAVVCTVCAVGIVLSYFCLAFNIYNRRNKYIKLSSPRLNNVAVIGCIHVYMAVILLGVDDSNFSDPVFSVMCSVQALLFAGGFTLTFGAMFIKTFRVHQICRGCQNGLVRSKMLRDTQLLSMILVLLGVDCSLLTLWIVLDPMQRKMFTLYKTPETVSSDHLFVYRLARCNSVHIVKWTVAFYAYKGLLLLFGVYLAWETRRIQIPALNDSQYIGLNIYNVLLSSTTVVVLSNVLADRPILSYAVVSALIILSTTTLLALLFLPKIYAIWKNGDENHTVTTSEITVEANTRRFAVDERRESQYRAQIHNRVHRRTLAELEREIQRLERQLTEENSAVEQSQIKLKSSGHHPSIKLNHSDQDRSGYFSSSFDSTFHKQKTDKQDSNLQSLSIRNRYLRIFNKIKKRKSMQVNYPEDLDYDSCLDSPSCLVEVPPGCESKYVGEGCCDIEVGEANECSSLLVQCSSDTDCVSEVKLTVSETASTKLSESLCTKSKPGTEKGENIILLEWMNQNQNQFICPPELTPEYVIRNRLYSDNTGPRNRLQFKTTARNRFHSDTTEVSSDDWFDNAVAETSMELGQWKNYSEEKQDNCNAFAKDRFNVNTNARQMIANNLDFQHITKFQTPEKGVDKIQNVVQSDKRDLKDDCLIVELLKKSSGLPKNSTCCVNNVDNNSGSQTKGLTNKESLISNVQILPVNLTSKLNHADILQQYPAEKDGFVSMPDTLSLRTLQLIKDSFSEDSTVTGIETIMQPAYQSSDTETMVDKNKLITKAASTDSYKSLEEYSTDILNKLTLPVDKPVDKNDKLDRKLESSECTNAEMLVSKDTINIESNSSMQTPLLMNDNVHKEYDPLIFLSEDPSCDAKYTKEDTHFENINVDSGNMTNENLESKLKTDLNSQSEKDKETADQSGGNIEKEERERRLRRQLSLIKNELAARGEPMLKVTSI